MPLPVSIRAGGSRGGRDAQQPVALLLPAAGPLSGGGSWGMSMLASGSAAGLRRARGGAAVSPAALPPSDAAGARWVREERSVQQEWREHIADLEPQHPPPPPPPPFDLGIPAAAAAA